MVSIIVPVYNVEKYLERCLDCILRQTFRDYEVILVDDGSTDGSPEICDRMAEKDTRFKVIHQENGGPSKARNAGIVAAAGEYITYVDSDDIIAPDFLEKMLGLVRKFNAEVASCGIAIVEEEASGGPLPSAAGTGEDYWLDGETAVELMLYGKLRGTSACGLLMTAGLSKGHLFPVGRYHEDDCVSYRYLLDAERVAVTKENLYFYVQRAGSIMHSDYGKISLDELDAGDQLLNAGKKLGPAIERAATVKRFDNYCQVLLANPDLKQKDRPTYDRVRKALREMRMPVLGNPQAPRIFRFYALMLLGGEKTLRLAKKFI